VVEIPKQISTTINILVMNKKITNIMYNTETFIKKAKEKHRDFYDYSYVDYKGSREKVEIICPKHGPFW
jgi:hypothetical protein